MTAYVIIQVKVSDPALLKAYQQKAPDIIKKYHGKILARGGETVTLEGNSKPDRVVIIEFPSLAQANSFYSSTEYTEARSLREHKAEFDIIVTEGIN